ncbi:MAG: hypothetical protein U0163_01255 [Gemmatimonadaceae bacterium]
MNDGQGARRAALGCSVLSMLLIALAYGLTLVPAAAPAPAWGGWLMALGTAGLFASLTVLGAVRRNRPWRAVAWAVGFIFVVIFGAFGAALLLAPDDASSALVLGLPLRAAIVIYGIGVVPALVLPLVYAKTFDTLTLSADDLEQVRADARRAQDEMAS